MPRKRLTKADKDTLADLVERYSATLIARSALKMKGSSRNRPRPFRKWMICMFVDIKRDGGRLSASRAAELVAKDQKAMFGDDALSARRIREIYCEVKGMQREIEAMDKRAREEDPAIEESTKTPQLRQRT